MNQQIIDLTKIVFFVEQLLDLPGFAKYLSGIKLIYVFTFFAVSFDTLKQSSVVIGKT